MLIDENGVVEQQKNALLSYQKNSDMKRALTVFALSAAILVTTGFQLIKTTLSVTARDEVGNTVAGRQGAIVRE